MAISQQTSKRDHSGTPADFERGRDDYKAKKPFDNHECGEWVRGWYYEYDLYCDQQDSAHESAIASIKS